jgi:hypothetical protein
MNVGGTAGFESVRARMREEIQGPDDKRGRLEVKEQALCNRIPFVDGEPQEKTRDSPIAGTELASETRSVAERSTPCFGRIHNK